MDSLQNLKEQLAQIAQKITDKQDVVYLDYPLHLNVGDLLIYLGTEQFFKDYGIRVRLRRSERDFDINEVKKYITPNTTILCHGGGNFGDLYPVHQNLRETVVKAFPNNRIIILPQTFHFSSAEKMAPSARIFKQHSDCHLFARDKNTLEKMQQFSENVSLSPDMAHQLYGKLPFRQNPSTQKQTLYFLRKDIEATSLEKTLQSSFTQGEQTKDWDDLLSNRDNQTQLWLSRVAKIANKLKLNFIKNWIANYWFSYANTIVHHSVNEFTRYDNVITSRLHGHIFSCLLGIENEVLDNSYGKNSGYFGIWTKELPYTKLNKS